MQAHASRLAPITAALVSLFLPLASFGQAGNPKLLMVIPDARPADSDKTRAAAFQSWGYDVVFQVAGGSRAELLEAAANADVCFISKRSPAATVGRKLTDSPVGIVTDNYWLADDFRLTRSFTYQPMAGSAIVATTSHPVTADASRNEALPDLLGTGRIAYSISGRTAPGAVVLTTYLGDPHFLAIEKTATLGDGSVASGRRVLLGHADFNRANATVQKMYENALQWAMDTSSRTYFVRREGDDASDGGSPDTAFATMIQAARIATAGDTVYVGAGQYAGRVVVAHGGYQGKSLQFVADVDGRRTGDAGEVTLAGNASSSAVYADHRFDTSFSGFAFENARTCVYWRGGDRLTLSNCQIRDGSTHGVYVDSASAALTNCVVEECKEGLVAARGGGLRLGNCRVADNQRTGAAARDADSTLDIEDSQFSGGTTSASWLNGASGSATRCSLADASATAAYMVRHSHVSLEQCTISGSRNGVYANGSVTSSTTVSACRISSNSGVGLLAYHGETAMTNCLVRHNGDDGVRLYYGSGRVAHNTIVNNGRDGLDTGRQARFEVVNNIIAGNTTYGLIGQPQTLTNDHNLIHGNRYETRGVAPGPNSLLVNPTFLNSNSDFHLAAASPAVDEATRSVAVGQDLEGRPRPNGAGPDIGCYESSLQRRVKISKWNEVR